MTKVRATVLNVSLCILVYLRQPLYLAVDITIAKYCYKSRERNDALVVN